MPSKEIEFAKKLAEDAGKIMRTYFRSEEVRVEFKEDNTPLTQADTRVNRLVIDRVKKTFPTYGVIGEEESFEEEREMVWVVDPIDGTIPFSLGIPISTFSLALVERKNGESKVAVVYDPYLNNLYYAEKNKGTYLNSKKLKTLDSKVFAHNYFYISGRDELYNGGKTADLIEAEGGKCMSLISFAYAGAKVAAGELVACNMRYGSPWDSAAASLLVQEAGGIATDLAGYKRRYDEFANGSLLSANETIHKKLLEKITQSKK